MKSLSVLIKKPAGSALIASALFAASLSPAANAADLTVLKTGKRIYSMACHVVSTIDKGFVAVIGATSDKVIKRMEDLVEGDEQEQKRVDEAEALADERAESWAPPHMYKF